MNQEEHQWWFQDQNHSVAITQINDDIPEYGMCGLPHYRPIRKKIKKKFGKHIPKDKKEKMIKENEELAEQYRLEDENRGVSYFTNTQWVYNNDNSNQNNDKNRNFVNQITIRNNRFCIQENGIDKSQHTFYFFFVLHV